MKFTSVILAISLSTDWGPTLEQLKQVHINDIK